MIERVGRKRGPKSADVYNCSRACVLCSCALKIRNRSSNIPRFHFQQGPFTYYIRKTCHSFGSPVTYSKMFCSTLCTGTLSMAPSPLFHLDVMCESFITRSFGLLECLSQSNNLCPLDSLIRVRRFRSQDTTWAMATLYHCK